MTGLNLSFNALLQAYRSGALTPEQVVEHCLAAIAASSGNPIWIRPLTREELEPYLAALRTRNPALLPRRALQLLLRPLQPSRQPEHVG